MPRGDGEHEKPNAERRCRGRRTVNTVVEEKRPLTEGRPERQQGPVAMRIHRAR